MGMWSEVTLSRMSTSGVKVKYLTCSEESTIAGKLLRSKGFQFRHSRLEERKSLSFSAVSLPMPLVQWFRVSVVHAANNLQIQLTYLTAKQRKLSSSKENPKSHTVDLNYKYLTTRLKSCLTVQFYS